MNHIPQPDLDLLLAAAMLQSHNDWLMILVASNHGLRVSEVISMKGTQVVGGRLYVKRLKGSLATDQPMLANEREALEARAIEVGNGLMFPICRRTAWRRIKLLMREVGLVSAKPRTYAFHSLKHSTGKLASERGMQMPKLQQWMGHKSLNSTAAYTKCDDNEAYQAFVAVQEGN
jgi:integrase